MNTEREKLIERLTTCQNHPFNSHIDIMTFAGFMTTTEQLKRYVSQHETDLIGKAA